MQFIDLQSQYTHLSSQINESIQRVLQHGQYIGGPEVGELESQLANYVGVKNCISCANGTDALQLALMSLGVTDGDAVFCPTFTFFASAEVISLVKATPVFVDINADTYNLCTRSLEQQIEATIQEGKLRPKAIIAVDLFGLPADYAAIEAIADKYDLKLIEDAAQGFGGSINGKKAGSFGDVATTSFFPAKPLGCYGDGGAIFTDSDEVASLLRSLCVHGKGADKYDNVRIGVNSRLDTLQAAILLQKLQAFDHELTKRNELAEEYSCALESHVVTPVTPAGYYSSWAQYTIRVENRDRLIERLKGAGIPSAVYYRTCMHEQTAFKNIASGSAFPAAESITKEVLSLPMHPYWQQADIDKTLSVLIEETTVKN